jgi:large subunit ribosomal protein L18
LAVFRSLNHIYAQVIDDVEGVTLAAAGSTESDVRTQSNDKRKADVSALVGTLVAQRASEKGVESVVFDRGGYKYH